MLPPQLSSDVFRTEVRQGSFAVSALHSRATQRLNAAVSMMKHSLDAQLVVRSGPCLLLIIVSPLRPSCKHWVRL